MIVSCNIPDIDALDVSIVAYTVAHGCKLEPCSQVSLEDEHMGSADR